MGYSDVQYAQARLIEHKNRLNQEIEEYQRVQGGGQQSVAVEEPVVQQELIRQEPMIQQETMSQQEVVAQESIVQQEQYTQAQYDQVEYEKDHVDPKYSESFEPPIDETIYEEEPIIEEPVVKKLVTEEPVLKANKVIVLHGKPRKLVLAKDKVEPIIDDKNYEIKVDENPNIDVTYNEGNESLNDDNKSLNDNSESLDDDVDDILSEIGE
jgi:hypothetical protein